MKSVDKNKLFEFFREMEFNRLLSQAIRFYGESQTSGAIQPSQVKKKTDILYYNLH